MDIFRTLELFLWVNVTFYDAVNMIHEVITTANPFPYTCTARFRFVCVRNKKTQQTDVERKIEYVHSFAVYQKYLTQFREIIILSPRLENYQFCQPC